MRVKIYTVETVLMQGKDGRIAGHCNMMRTVNGYYHSFKAQPDCSEIVRAIEKAEELFNFYIEDPRQLSFEF
jgi:hypothetical protein